MGGNTRAGRHLEPPVADSVSFSVPGEHGLILAANVPLLEMAGIEKRFGDVLANRAVDLKLHAGEVLGLLGENGAGKTTLMNILFGFYRADAGRISIRGKQAVIASPADAIAHGIGMVHQHAHVVDRHSVAENLLVGWPGQGLRLDHGLVASRLGEIGAAYGLVLDPARKVASLSVGEKQRLEIVKALFRGARILILDEPTSVLTPLQAEGLFKAIRAMIADGVGVIFISHKLNQVRAITSRVMVMRRGAVVAALPNEGSLTNARLAELMCGHELKPVRREAVSVGPIRIEARGLVLQRHGQGAGPSPAIELAIRGGEILGLAGVSGNGQVQLAEALAGVRPAPRGTLLVDGMPVPRPSPRSLQGLGLAYIPEDRLGAGLVAGLPLEASMVLPRIHMAPFSHSGIVDRRAIRAFAQRQIEAYSIRPSSPGIATGLFSGGNQQKAIVARELAFEPRILIIAQPTRGLDVSASELVHREIMKLRSKGCAILLISDDLDEILQLSDRIAVLYESAIVHEATADAIDAAAIGLAMTSGTIAARSSAPARLEVQPC